MAGTARGRFRRATCPCMQHGELEAHAVMAGAVCDPGRCVLINCSSSVFTFMSLLARSRNRTLAPSQRVISPLDCSRARRGSSRRQSNLLATSAEMLAATSAVMFAATSSATSRVEHSFLRSSSVCHSCGPPSSASWVVSHPWVVLHPWASLHPWSLVRACTSQLAGRPTAPYRAPPRRRPRRLR